MIDLKGKKQAAMIIAIPLLFIAVGILLIIAIPELWQWLQPSSAKLAEIRNNAVKTIFQMVGGLIVIFGLYLTYRRIRASEKNVEVLQDQQVTERFTRAIEQLGSEKLEVRLGAIYALERIAKDSPKDHWTVMEILTAYVRENSKWTEEKDEEWRIFTKDRNLQRKIDIKAKIDIQTIITILGRRSHIGNEPDRINLSETDLRLYKFINSDFTNAVFYKTHFDGAYIKNTRFDNSYFISASFFQTDIINVSMANTQLADAKMNPSFLVSIDFKDAKLTGIDLRGCSLTGAINLTLDQLKIIKEDELTRLPEYLRRD
ncbi:pentapeptide repeat-containing protein [candidate division KSB1 bacterium]|nr:pentapeptide repeat-containing protein [candidate division KSB1 bacterium]